MWQFLKIATTVFFFATASNSVLGVTASPVRLPAAAITSNAPWTPAMQSLSTPVQTLPTTPSAILDIVIKTMAAPATAENNKRHLMKP